jgi:hypothetical protein
MWNEATVACFKRLSRHLPGVNEGHRGSSQDSRDSVPESSEYKAAVLTTRPLNLV